MAGCCTEYEVCVRDHDCDPGVRLITGGSTPIPTEATGSNAQPPCPNGWSHRSDGCADYECEPDANAPASMREVAGFTDPEDTDGLRSARPYMCCVDSNDPRPCPIHGPAQSAQERAE